MERAEAEKPPGRARWRRGREIRCQILRYHTTALYACATLVNASSSHEMSDTRLLIIADHPWLDIAADNFRPPQPEFQRNKDTRANDPSTATDDNPCSNPMTSAMDNGQRSQSNRNQTANHPVSVSDHYTGHSHVGYELEDGDYSGKSADLDVHNIEHVPVDLRMSSLQHNNQHISESRSEADFQLQADFPQSENSLCKETGPSLHRQNDMLDRSHSRPVEKPYECRFCDKRFSTQSSLTSYERTHREKKTFQV
ncbi:zinc finger protein 436-like [Sycon ciliatum]|uniref:zinc finger protein 436-like n=1 Tax=Sycon ciliatum TaxID=27933 RepID=UPI0031F68504